MLAVPRMILLQITYIVAHNMYNIIEIMKGIIIIGEHFQVGLG